LKEAFRQGPVNAGLLVLLEARHGCERLVLLSSPGLPVMLAALAELLVGQFAWRPRRTCHASASERLYRAFTFSPVLADLHHQLHQLGAQAIDFVLAVRKFEGVGQPRKPFEFEAVRIVPVQAGDFLEVLDDEVLLDLRLPVRARHGLSFSDSGH
jgi:hypothetical protein